MRSRCEVLWFRHKMDSHFKAVTKKRQVPSFLHDLSSRSDQWTFPWDIPISLSSGRGGLALAGGWLSALPGVATGRNLRLISKFITTSPTQGLTSETTHSLFISLSLSLCCWVGGPWDAGRPLSWCPGSIPRAAGLAPERQDDASGMICFIRCGC